MVGRGELTDVAWARIEPLLPTPGGRGGRWRDHRQVINAIRWQLRTGAPWRDLSERYGPLKTAYERLRKMDRGRHLGPDPGRGDRQRRRRRGRRVDLQHRLQLRPSSSARRRSPEKMTCGGDPSAQRTVGASAVVELEEAPDADRRRIGHPPAAD